VMKRSLEVCVIFIFSFMCIPIAIEDANVGHKSVGYASVIA
jgi:hypothetical protein